MSSKKDDRESGSKSGATGGSTESNGPTADTLRDNTKVDIREAGKEGGGKTETPDRQRDAT